MSIRSADFCCRCTTDCIVASRAYWSGICSAFNSVLLLLEEDLPLFSSPFSRLSSTELLDLAICVRPENLIKYFLMKIVESLKESVVGERQQ